jgi:TRAP-type C4-dicarboxylate transport system permease small subunit
MERRRLKLKKREENKFWNGLIKAERAIIIVAGAGTTLVVGGAMILRETIGVNFIGFEEILIIVAYWLYMIGCGHGSYEKSQITADIISVMMPECLGKDIILFARDVIGTALAIVFMVWAYNFAVWAIVNDLRTPVFRIPMVLGQGTVFLGMVLVTFYNVVYLYDDVKALIGKYGKKKMASGIDLSEAKGV